MEESHECEPLQSESGEDEKRSAANGKEFLPLEKLRMIVVGKTGSGKSSLCNQLMGQKLFRATEGLRTATETTQEEVLHRLGCEITVVDTPETLEKDFVATEKRRILKENCNTVIIFCVRCDARFAAEEYSIYKELKMLWGDEKDFNQRLLVAFTHGDKSDLDERQFEDSIYKSMCESVTSDRQRSGDHAQGSLGQLEESIKISAPITKSKKQSHVRPQSSSGFCEERVEICGSLTSDRSEPGARVRYSSGSENIFIKLLEEDNVTKIKVEDAVAETKKGQFSAPEDLEEKSQDEDAQRQPKSRLDSDVGSDENSTSEHKALMDHSEKVSVEDSNSLPKRQSQDSNVQTSVNYGTQDHDVMFETQNKEVMCETHVIVDASVMGDTERLCGTQDEGIVDNHYKEGVLEKLNKEVACKAEVSEIGDTEEVTMTQNKEVLFETHDIGKVNKERLPQAQEKEDLSEIQEKDTSVMHDTCEVSELGNEEGVPHSRDREEISSTQFKDETSGDAISSQDETFERQKLTFSQQETPSISHTRKQMPESKQSSTEESLDEELAEALKRGSAEAKRHSQESKRKSQESKRKSQERTAGKQTAERLSFETSSDLGRSQEVLGAKGGAWKDRERTDSELNRGKRAMEEMLKDSERQLQAVLRDSEGRFVIFYNKDGYTDKTALRRVLDVVKQMELNCSRHTRTTKWRAVKITIAVVLGVACVLALFLVLYFKGILSPQLG